MQVQKTFMQVRLKTFMQVQKTFMHVRLRRTEWGDTALQTQDSKFEPWLSEAEHLPLGHGLNARAGSNPWSPAFQAGSFNNCTSPPPPPIKRDVTNTIYLSVKTNKKFQKHN